MLAIENVFYACRWFMRNNLFTALLKRIHEGILIAIPHEALLFIIKLILSFRLAEVIPDRLTFCVTPRAPAVKGCLRLCRFPTALSRFCSTRRSPKALHQKGHGGVNLCAKVFWACSPAETYRLHKTSQSSQPAFVQTGACLWPGIP